MLSEIEEDFIDELCLINVRNEFSAFEYGWIEDVALFFTVSYIEIVSKIDFFLYKQNVITLVNRSWVIVTIKNRKSISHILITET